MRHLHSLWGSAIYCICCFENTSVIRFGRSLFIIIIIIRWWWWWWFWIGSYFIAQTDFKLLVVFLSQPSKYWDTGLTVYLSLQVLSERTNIEPWVCANIIRLFNDDNTIPFIVRYRKELINNLDADSLREVRQTLEELRWETQGREGWVDLMETETWALEGKREEVSYYLDGPSALFLLIAVI